MKDTTNQYAMAVLKDKRATIASEIVETQRHLRHLRDQLVHVDATIKILDPAFPVGSIKNKRPIRQVKLFRHGELGRIILDALRKADGPQSVAQIAAYMADIGGHGPGALKTLGERVRGNLAYMKRMGKVVPSTSDGTVAWQIVASSD